LRTERGSVLLHVMVTGVLLALISATILRMSLLRYQMGGRGATVLQEKRADQSGLSSVLAGWNAAQTTCKNNVTNYTCAPAAGASPGVCGCTCTPNVQTNPPTLPTIVAGPGLITACPITITSINMP
jgi:hypothetical protein